MRQVGQLAEELGYKAILIGDHIAFPKTINSDYPHLKQSQDRGQNPYTIFTQMEWLDSFTVLAFLVDGSTLSEADIKAYSDIGVHSLYTLAAVPGPEAMLAHVREFAVKVKNAVE